MTTDDRDLVQAAKQDPQQFDALYRKYFQTIYNYFWYRVDHNNDVAEDLTQDTFVRAFRSMSTFTITKASYLSYLLTIAHNLLVNYYRSAKTVPLDHAPDIPIDTWGEIEVGDGVERLWKAIQALSPTERDILYLKYRRGYKVAVIAEITGKSENAIKLVLSRARKKLAGQPSLQHIATFGEVSRTPSKPRYKAVAR